jgi:hypothetical protein
MGYKSNHRVLVEKPSGKRPHGTLRRRWEDNCDMYLMVNDDWLRLAEDGDMSRAVVNAVMNPICMK